jgi:hypothetical protein
MKPIALALAGVLVLGVSACAKPSISADAAAPASAPATQTDQAKIHIQVLRRYLTTPEDNANIGNRSRIFILDHTEPVAADPMSGDSGGTPLPQAEKDAIVQGLKDLGKVTFVADRHDAMANKDGCDLVRDNGILMIVGPPMTAGDKYQVGVNGFVACSGATWLTYVVEKNYDQWRVTGTTGSVAVA